MDLEGQRRGRRKRRLYGAPRAGSRARDGLIQIGTSSMPPRPPSSLCPHRSCSLCDRRDRARRESYARPRGSRAARASVTPRSSVQDRGHRLYYPHCKGTAWKRSHAIIRTCRSHTMYVQDHQVSAWLMLPVRRGMRSGIRIAIECPTSNSLRSRYDTFPRRRQQHYAQNGSYAFREQPDVNGEKTVA